MHLDLKDKLVGDFEQFHTRIGHKHQRKNLLAIAVICSVLLKHPTYTHLVKIWQGYGLLPSDIDVDGMAEPVKNSYAEMLLTGNFDFVRLTQLSLVNAPVDCATTNNQIESYSQVLKRGNADELNILIIGLKSTDL